MRCGTVTSAESRMSDVGVSRRSETKGDQRSENIGTNDASVTDTAIPLIDY